MTIELTRRHLLKGTAAATVSASGLILPAQDADAFMGFVIRFFSRFVPQVVRAIGRMVRTNAGRGYAARRTAGGAGFIAAADAVWTISDIYHMLHMFSEPVRRTAMRTFEEVRDHDDFEDQLESIWRADRPNHVTLSVNNPGDRVTDTVVLSITNVDTNEVIASRPWVVTAFPKESQSKIHLPPIRRLPNSLNAGDRIIVDGFLPDNPQVRIEPSNIIIVERT